MYNRDLLDYSDGSGDPEYDQADWLHIYLPRFQTQDLAVESATFDGPIVDELGAIGRLEYGMVEWEYNKNLSEDFIDKIDNWSPIDPISCDWRIYYNENISIDEVKNLRVYALPMVSPTPAEYVLVDEGILDDNNMIWNFYLNEK